MNWTDIVNGLFEICGGFFIIPSIAQAFKTTEVKSINWVTVMFFTVWGFWNVYFYPVNGFMLSFWGGIFLATMNLIWLLRILYNKKYGN